VFELLNMALICLPMIVGSSHSDPLARIMYGRTLINDEVFQPARGGQSKGVQEFIDKIQALVQRTLYQVYNTLFSMGVSDLAYNGLIPSWRRTIEMAEYLDRIYRNVGAFEKALQDSTQPIPADMADMAPLMRQLKHTNDMWELMDELAAGKGEDSQPLNPEEGEFNNNISVPNNGYDKPRWGKMKIETPKLTERLKGKFMRKSKTRSSDYGTVPRNIHRMLQDGNVFSTKRLEYTVSILIDASGSMNFSERQIQQMVEEMPAAVVGVYSGSGSSGTLRIVAEKGRWTKNVRTPGRNNLIDLPALEWLAEQPGPRIWVSDGLVIPTGGSNQKANQQCVDACLKHDINRVENVREAIKVLKGERVLLR